MRFYIIFYTNVMSGHVMSGLTLLCADLRFGLPRASPPLQSPFHSSFSLLLDFLLPPLRFKVQSSAISRSFWTSSHLPSTSKSNLPLLLALFGLPRIPPPLQSPICHSFSLFLDFLLPLLCLKVQSSAISRSFWTSSCLLSTSKSNPPLFLTPFGLPRASPPLQSPFCHSCSLLLDFLTSPLHFKVQSAALPRSSTQKRRIAKQSASRNPPVSINQSNPPSANSTK